MCDIAGLCRPFGTPLLFTAPPALPCWAISVTPCRAHQLHKPGPVGARVAGAPSHARTRISVTRRSVPADSSTLRLSPTSPKDATGIAQHGSAGKAWQKCVGVPQGRHDLLGVYPNSKYLNRPSSRAIQSLRPQKGRGERRMKGGSFQFLLTLWLRKPVMEPVWRGCKRSPNQFLPTEAKNGVGALRDRVATCIKESDKRNVAKMCRFLCCGCCKARSILVHSESRNWRRPRR